MENFFIPRPLFFPSLFAVNGKSRWGATHLKLLHSEFRISTDLCTSTIRQDFLYRSLLSVRRRDLTSRTKTNSMGHAEQILSTAPRHVISFLPCMFLCISKIPLCVCPFLCCSSRLKEGVCVYVCFCLRLSLSLL